MKQLRDLSLPKSVRVRRAVTAFQDMMITVVSVFKYYLCHLWQLCWSNCSFIRERHCKHNKSPRRHGDNKEVS